MMHCSPHLKALFLSILCLSYVGKIAKAQQLDDKITLFNNTEDTYLYQNQIDLFGHYFSGLMLIKPLGSDDYKVAITTEFGAKILEFEMKDGQFILHNCIAEMDRKKVLKVIERDMFLLLGVFKQESMEIYWDDGVEVVRVQSGKYHYEYWCQVIGNLHQVQKLRLRKRNKELVNISLSGYSGSTPGTINITHMDKPINIEMKLIENNRDAAE